MSVTARSLPDAGVLRQRLEALRQRLRKVTLYRGISLVLALALPCAVVAGLLDWSCHLPGLIRALFLTGILTGSGLLAYRFLYLPLCARVDDLSLALRIEESCPALNDSLASTVEFLDQTPANSGDSAPMRREAVRRALGLAAGFDFNRIVDKRGLVGATVAAVVAANLIWPFFLVSPALAGTAVVRLINPFGTRDWPKQTRIDLAEFRDQIGCNELFEVKARISGVIPDQARVVFHFDGFRREEHRLTLAREGNNAGLCETRIEVGMVQRSFRFQVLANDAATEDFEIKVLPPPDLAPLDGESSPQLRLHFPAYTDLPSPLKLTPGTGNIDAVAGTFVEFRAAANRPLREAWLEYRPEQVLTPLSAFLAPLAAREPLSVLALSAGGQAAWERIPANLDLETKQRISVDFLPRLNGFYVLHIEDERRLRNSRVFELRLKTDPAPTVTLDRPSPKRDILSMLPTADVKLHVIAEDATFAVRSVYLRYRIRPSGQTAAAEGDPRESRVFSLHDPEVVRKHLLPLALGSGAGVWKALRPRPIQLDIQQTLSLRRIRHLDGSALQQGDVVVLQACADDFDNMTLNKQPGISHEVELRIVGPNTLDLELSNAQKLVEQELVKLREKEREAIQKVLEAEKRLKRGEQLTQDEQARLLEAEQLQQQIHEQIGKEDKGLRAEVSRIQETLKQNGLDHSAVRERMTDVARELERLSKRELERIEDRLTAARLQSERQTQLTEKGKETRKQALLEEQAARKKADAAAEAEEKAKNASDEKERAQLETEAQRQKQLAEAARQKAEELRKQAAREEEESSPQAARQMLTDARQHQEEVEKTLNDLLKRLEPWSSAREVKGDTKRILQDQKQLQAQLDDVKDKLKLDGKNLEELTPREKVELEAMRDQQQRIEDRMNQLLDKMDRIAEERDKANDHDTANELREARDKAQKGDISGQMKSAREQISKNKLNEARENQQKSIAELEELVKNLEDRREAELERLAKKLREAEKKLEELTEEQEKLLKKKKEAQQNPDAAQREEELKKLSRQQQQLQEKTRELVQQLTRLRADRASQSLDKAGQQMDQGKNGEDPQEALDRLNEAQRELEQARKQAEEELQREQLTRVAETIQRLKDRQEAFNASAARIQKTVQQANEWQRGVKISLLSLGTGEEGLGTETDDVARKELKGTPVFARMLRRAAEAMTDVNKRVQQMKGEWPDPKNLPDPELTRLQEHATKRLTQVLDAVKEQASGGKGSTGGNAGGGQGGQGDEGGGNSGGESGLPPPAQLKLLKALQMEVNQQTAAFQKKHPELDKLTPAEQTELQSIRKQQQDIVELLEELRRPADEPGDPEGEKK